MNSERLSSAPLAGLKVVEIASIGPGPHCAMLLADLGAQVLRIERAGGNGWPNPIADRSRSHLTLDIRVAEGREALIKSVRDADVLIEGMRPGVMERLDLGPDTLLTHNERLVYARLTGWGQEGPLAQTAGHDINYIALTGALAAMGREGEPAAIPLNLVGYFGGGSMLAAFGIMVALWERERSGKGQVVDAAIIEGVNSMMSFFDGLRQSGRISMDRAKNLLGGAAPFYRTYLCEDLKEVAVGALEPQFFAELVRSLGLEQFSSSQHDEASWQEMAEAFQQAFRSRTRDEWAEVFLGTDACVSPVLTLDEVASHPHHRHRSGFSYTDGISQVAAVPRFSRSVPKPP